AVLLVTTAFTDPIYAAPASRVSGDAVVSGSCTESDLVNALVAGGTITFNCGGPKTIPITSVKTIAQDTTLSGGDVITLSGGFSTRLFVVDPGIRLTLEHIVL